MKVLMLTVMLASSPSLLQHSGEELPTTTSLLPEPDVGTLPYAEYTYYLVTDYPGIDGMRVSHRMNRTTNLVYEFVDVRSLLRPIAASSNQVGFGWAMAEEMMADAVFGGGVILPGAWGHESWGTTQFSCTAGDCSEPNNLCNGWCSGPLWTCVCTPYEVGTSSDVIAKRHQKRVSAAMEVWPPE